MKLSNEQWQLVFKNKRLVHFYIQKKLGIDTSSPDYEDLESIGTYGLIKAAATYDSKKKIKFSTYAMRCICNEIGMDYRKKNKHKNDISLDAPISEQKDEGEKITIRDTLEDPNGNFTERMMRKDKLSRVLSIILNCLNAAEKYVILCVMAEVQQEPIAERLELSQSNISRITSKTKVKIREIYEQEIDYREKVEVNLPIENEELVLAFRLEDISYANFLESLEDAINRVNALPDTKLENNEEKIIMRMPISSETMVFIAEIFMSLEKKAHIP